MNPAEYENLAAHEETHWWFVAKRKLIRQCIERYRLLDEDDSLVLDIGCGAGAILAEHRLRSPHAFGLDYSPEALKFSRRKHRGYLGQASALRLPLVSNSLNLVTILNVLYHQWIPDDEAVLAEIYRLLKPGGCLILTDSAFSFLSGPHDEINLTARRYTVPQMRAKLTKVGFKIQKESYAYALLFPVVFLQRWYQRTFSKNAPPLSDIQPVPPILNTILLGLFQLELVWLKRGSLPWGTSVLFVAEK
jgi:SAM-dependent methyltransferase